MSGPSRTEAPEAWRGTLAEFETYLEALGYSPATISSRRQHIRMLAEQCGVSPEQVTQADLLRHLGRCKSREYKKSNLNSFRLFFRWYVGTAHGRDDNPCDGIPSVRKATPKPKPCPDSAIYAALKRAGALEKTAILLAAECGLRRGEIARVHSRDVVKDSSGHRSLVVVGKGDKQRIVPLPDSLADVIEAADGYVFPGRYGGHIEEGWITKHVGRLLPPGYSVHKLRHRFATISYAQSHDLLAVSKALGHSSTETTMNYTALPDAQLRPLVDNATMTTDITPASPARSEPHRRRRKAGNSREAVRAAMLLADCLAYDLKYKNRHSFATSAEAFAERFSIKADGHASRSGTVRAGARLLQASGLIELATGEPGELCGNVIADFVSLMKARNRYKEQSISSK